jgi:zinc transport system substrate-binding protein
MTRLAILALVALVASGCGGDSASDDRTTVVAAFYPLAWTVERIGGRGVDVVNLTPAGVEPHDLELTPRDVERVHDADLVLYLGDGFMPALEDAVEGRKNALDLLAGQPLHGRDPHVWLAPRRLARMARQIANALGNPAAAEPVVHELDALDGEYRQGLAHCARRELVTSHAAFGYLADAYGLDQVALSGLSPEVEPTPRRLEELVDEVRDSGATTVFFETLVSPRLAETVARDAGASVASLDPLEGLSADAIEDGRDYASVMRDNLATLREALGCR